MAFTITSGGSLGTALGLTLLAWGIRALRGAALRSLLEDTSNRFKGLKGLNFLLSRFIHKQKKEAVSISPSAFKFLMERDPVPFVVFQVFREEKRGSLIPRVGEDSLSASASSVSERGQQQQQQATSPSFGHSRSHSPSSATNSSYYGGRADSTRSFASLSETQEDYSTNVVNGGETEDEADGDVDGCGEEEITSRRLTASTGTGGQVQRLPEHVLRGILIRSISPRPTFRGGGGGPGATTHRSSFTGTATAVVSGLGGHKKNEHARNLSTQSHSNHVHLSQAEGGTGARAKDSQNRFDRSSF